MNDVDLQLGQDDAILLHRILSAYLSDLRMEIAATDAPRFRDELRGEEVQVGKLIRAVEALLSPADATGQP